MAKKKQKDSVEASDTSVRDATEKKIDEALTKKYKTRSLFDAASEDFVNFNSQKISTGELALDIMLGGGIELGRIIKVQGPFGCGKSKLLASIMSVATRFLNKRVLFVDYEGTSDPDWLQKQGVLVDKDHLKYSRPFMAEQTFDTIEAYFDAGTFDIIILDSLSSMVAQEEMEKAHDESTQALLARKASTFFRKIDSRQNKQFMEGKTPPTFIFTNHIRKNLHDRFNPEYTPGGSVQDERSSTIIELRKSSKITMGDGDLEEEMGFLVRAYGKKNKAGLSKKKAMFGVITDDGYEGHDAFSFYHADTLMRYGLKLGIIEQAGAWYSIPAFDLKRQGAANFHKDVILGNEQILQFIVDAVKDSLSAYPIQFQWEYIPRNSIIAEQESAALPEPA